MTPAAKPSIASSTVLFIPRNRTTAAAPSAVTPQVKSVAMSACTVCGSARNQSVMPIPHSIDSGRRVHSPAAL